MGKRPDLYYFNKQPIVGACVGCRRCMCGCLSLLCETHSGCYTEYIRAIGIITHHHCDGGDKLTLWRDGGGSRMTCATSGLHGEAYGV